jgi:catechol 2,3-dioxygenase-like lactoylglutathione lyase family enzyme
MFSHMMVGADDIDAAKSFYDATLGVMGAKPGRIDDQGRIVYIHDGGIFIVTKPINGEPASCANGGTIGFAMKSPEQANAWHEAGIAHGGTAIEDPPGPRVGSAGSLYLAYLRDPSGNKLCALHRMPA